MTRYIAFLRAINVGGHVVKMTALKAHFEALGLAHVETFIASGNVIFTSPAKAATLAPRIEARLRAALGYDVRTFLRTDAEVAGIAAYLPWPAPAMEAARSVSVGFLAEPLSPAGRKALLAHRSEVDDFHARGREIFWKLLVGQADSRFSNVALEKTVGQASTFRNVNTVRRLAAKYPP